MFQLQQYKLGGPPTHVPAIEDKPKENGQVDIGDQVSSVNKVIIISSNLTFWGNITIHGMTHA